MQDFAFCRDTELSRVGAMPDRLPELLRALEQRGICTSGELQEALGVSQATVSRLVKAAGERVVSIGRGRRTRYARALDPFTDLPIFQLDGRGTPEQVADLRPLHGGAFHVLPHRDELWLRGQGGDGFFGALPYFLDDLRPQGFIGRAIARALGAPFPPDPRDWSAAQVLTWLGTEGCDLPGDLVLGRRALERVRSRRRAPIDGDLARLADQAIAGEVAGSSAGGEQPKFIVSRGSSHRLVKFSGRGEGAEARRWRDILIAEHHALTVLAGNGIPAAESELVESDGRTFLMVRRFDRRGDQGRLPMISLAAVDAEFSGVAQGWTATMRRLADLGLVSSADARRAAWLELFGHWIGNTDMHLGNLSLRPEPEGFGLLPAYDMTSMRWAPIRGELPSSSPVDPPIRDLRLGDLWQETARVALAYWQRLQADPRLGADFREIAADCAATIGALLG